MTTQVNSVLYIRLTSTSGIVSINNEIPLQRLVIKQSSLTWGSIANSASGGDVLLLDIQPFTSAVINTNSIINGAIPLLNNTSSATTINNTEIPLDSDRSINQSFSYRIVKPDGSLPANFIAMNLIMSYNNGIIYT